MFPLFAFLGMAVLAGFLIWLAIRSSKQAQANFTQLTAKLGLVAPPPQATFGITHSALQAVGERRGKRVELYTFTTGAGKSRVTWVAVSAQPRRDGGLTFEIKRQGFGSKLAEVFGAKEIQVGDPAFDDAWFIQTNRSEFFRAALLPELRLKLEAAARGAMQGKFKLEKSRVSYAETGTFADTERCGRLERAMDVVIDLADVAEVYADSSDPS